MRQLLRHYEKKTNQKMAIIFNAKINKSTQNILVYINIGMYCSRYVKLTGLVSDPNLHPQADPDPHQCIIVS